MEDLLESGTVDNFFVASDTVGVLRIMQNLFPEGKVFYLDKDCDDRGGECEQYAMADLLVLSRTKILLGSTWSSFSEAAMRLGGPKALLASKFWWRELISTLHFSKYAHLTIPLPYLLFSDVFYLDLIA